MTTTDAPVAGLLAVVTESGSRYLIDFDRQRLRRMPVTDPRIDVAVPSVPLRRDRDWISLLEAPALAVGQSAVFVLEPLGDPTIVVFTQRVTTPIVSITPVDLAEAGGALLAL